MKNMVTKHTKLLFIKLNLNHSFNQTLKFQLRTVAKNIFHETIFFNLNHNNNSCVKQTLKLLLGIEEFEVVLP